MQLVEEDKLELDQDVNAYLDFKIPPREGEPITLRDIMTHTAGFEETIRGLITAEPEGVPPLGEVMKAWVPRSEEHTAELQSLMRISYAVFCLKKKHKKL